jgi:hypothetical protein
VACKGSKLNLGKEVAKFTLAQVSDTVSSFACDFTQAQHVRVQQELHRIADWLVACPYEFIGSSVLLAYDAQGEGGTEGENGSVRGGDVRVKLIDFGHVEQGDGTGAANQGNVLGIRTLQQILKQFIVASPPAAAAAAAAASE